MEPFHGKSRGNDRCGFCFMSFRETDCLSITFYFDIHQKGCRSPEASNKPRKTLLSFREVGVACSSSWSLNTWSLSPLKPMDARRTALRSLQSGTIVRPFERDAIHHAGFRDCCSGILGVVRPREVKLQCIPWEFAV